MARFAGPRHKLLLTITVAVVLLGLAAASHFRGGSIQWRPVDPVNFTREVSARHACELLDAKAIRSIRATHDDVQFCTGGYRYKRC